MTTLDELLSVEDITRQAREISPGRTLLTWIGALLFALGWVLRKTFALLWLASAWAFVAAREGWREAGKPPGARVSRATG
ncbi:MAG TPA: hypothetical protein VL652_45190 [Kutzneria sp.]|jgi:hypothetical protein|nr:hypothetical protein [Kutzneria sp.]